MIYDYCVIGGGIVGLATAMRLLEERPGSSVILLEKEDALGKHQTGHNSGVIHAGIYYPPGSLKAELCREGAAATKAFCAENGIRFEICGKLVVATSDLEMQRMDALYERSKQNTIEVHRLGTDELKEREPHANGEAALLVPEEGIVDYAAVIAKLVEVIRTAGGELLTGAGVRAIESDNNHWRITHACGELEADFVVNCAGLHCDQVSVLAGEKRTTRIVPFRGEYFELRPERRHLVRHLIYPVPDPQFPFLGVHFTRMIGGGAEAVVEGRSVKVVGPSVLRELGLTVDNARVIVYLAKTVDQVPGEKTLL